MFFNDVQREILRDLRGNNDPGPITPYETDDLYDMLDACEDPVIRFEIHSMLKHADE